MKLKFDYKFYGIIFPAPEFTKLDIQCLEGVELLIHKSLVRGAGVGVGAGAG